MSQNIYNVVSILAIFSLAFAVFQLKHEVDIFRIQMAKIITSMGILIKTTADGTSLEVNDKVKIIQYADEDDEDDDEEE